MMLAWLGIGASTAAFVYAYGGNIALLRVVAMFRHSPAADHGPVGHSDSPGVTVYIGARDEAERIVARLENLVAQDYPADRVEIIVISDGSTDDTAGRVRAFMAAHGERRIRIEEFSENRGPAAIQNLAAKLAHFDILISTDADSEFAPDCIARLTEPFAHAEVAVAGGLIVYRGMESAIATSIGYYRKMEYRLREAEQAIGLMAKTDGPCTAYRKAIWTDLLEFEAVDQVITLLARKHGMRSVHVPTAICYDTPNSRWRQEVKSRARMTRKGLFAIHNRWQLEDIARDPAFSFVLYSHRHARYFSPVYLLVFVLSCGVLAADSGDLPQLIISIAGVVVIAGVGAAARIPAVLWLIDRVRTFLLANLGFASGIAGWVAGNRTGRYVPSRTL